MILCCAVSPDSLFQQGSLQNPSLQGSRQGRLCAVLLLQPRAASHTSWSLLWSHGAGLVCVSAVRNKQKKLQLLYMVGSEETLKACPFPVLAFFWFPVSEHSSHSPSSKPIPLHPSTGQAPAGLEVTCASDKSQWEPYRPAGSSLQLN